MIQFMTVHLYIFLQTPSVPKIMFRITFKKNIPLNIEKGDAYSKLCIL